jgi:hypothetical protein
MGYVPYVGFATYHRATVKIRFYFKRLMFMQMFCNNNNKKKWVVTRSFQHEHKDRNLHASII